VVFQPQQTRTDHVQFAIALAALATMSFGVA
jgi:hypothetical protein